MRLRQGEAASGRALSIDAPYRRTFLKGVAALGAGALLPGCASVEPHRSAARCIDVHHHFISPGYTAALKSLGIRTVRWSVQATLEDMDKSGIATGVLSLPPPAAELRDPALARKVARESNDYGAQLRRDHPGRFGLFAAIPYADTEGSLREIEHALDTLKADGVGLMTSYGGRYLGDQAFWPVLEELNRRKAVVYTHPTMPQCCSKIPSGVSIGTIEYAVDTTRTMASLMFYGAAARYPDIRWIFSHSGGVTPYLLSRFEREEAVVKDRERKLPRGVMHELRKFHYEIAQGNHPGALAALLKIAPVSQVLYGTDFPFRDGAEANSGLAAYGFSAADLRAINRDNALKLLPGLQA
jgi:predicted TIM-barrel fold metal-dependent hydrolase